MKNPMNLLRLSVLLFAACATQMANAATAVWNGAGADLNWSTSLNWSTAPSGNAVLFPDGAFPVTTNTSGTPNNIVSANITITSLTYTNNKTLGNYVTTLINPNVTLKVTGPLVVDGVTGGNEFDTTAAMAGTNCTLIVSNIASTCYIGGASAANVESAIFTLPDGTNLITAGTFNVGISSGGNGRTSTLNLGNSTNVINANIIQLGLSKASGTVQFAGPNGSLTIRGTNGTGRVNQLVMGFSSSGSGSSAGKLLLAGHPANVLVYTNILGEDTADTGTPSSSVTIDNGTYDVTTLLMGLLPSTATGGSTANTFTLGGDPLNTATLIVNSPAGPGGGSFIISDSNGGSGGTHAGAGTLNINTNGNAQIYCSITKLQTAENTGTITLNGGILTLEAATNVIGSAAVPMDNVNLNGGTMQFSVNGANVTTANITANAVGAGMTYGPNVINISSVTNVIAPVTIHLITYVGGGDPGLGNFLLGSIPAGYNATLQDNLNSDNSIDLVIGANIPIYPLLWVGAVGNTINGNWNLTAMNWLNLTNGSPLNYANPDFTYFDDTASNSTVTLATNFLPAAFTFSNSVLNYVLGGPGSISGSVGLIMDGTASVKLAESGGDNFSGGVAVNSGTVILDDANSTNAGPASVASGATLQIGNNDANGNLSSSVVTVDGSLIFDQTSSSTISTAITGYGALTLNGSGTVTLSSGGNAYTGNTAVNAGTLALTGSGTISNSTSVSVTSSTLDVSRISNVSLLNSLNLANAVITLTATNVPYLQAPVAVVSGSLNMSGSGNTVNVTAVPTIATYPSILQLIQTPSGISGFNMALGTLPAGYSGYVSNNNNASVVLVLTSGPTGARPYVTWAGVDQLSSVNTNWTDALNWELPGQPLASDAVAFAEADVQGSSSLSSPGGGVTALIPNSANNIVDANFTISSLTYTNINNDYHNTYINDGVTLTITNTATNNILSIGGGLTDFGGNAKGSVSIAGPNATVNVLNTNGALIVAYGTASVSSQQATLDMSALGTFNASVNTFEVGALSTVAVGLSGVAYLAETNNITAIGGSVNEGGQSESLSLLVGETGKNATTESFLYLGQSNSFNVNGIGIGIAKQSAEMQFNPALTSPTAVFHGGDGVSPVAVWSIGDGLAQSGSSSTPAGTADFTGGTVNALVNLMYIGRTPNASGPHAATGTLTFGAGTISAGTVYDGFQAFNDTDYGVGAVNVNGTGVLQVNTLNLAWTTGITEASPTTGALNITGGTVSAGTIAADTNNTGQSSIALNGGLLVVTNTIGSSAAPLTSLTLQGGALQLSPNASGTNIVAGTVTIGSPTTINIASVATVSGGTLQIPLISYMGSDPTAASLTLGTIPFGYSSASLGDDGVSQIYLTITTPASLSWVGALSNSSLDGNWNTSDQNWLSGAVYSAYGNPDFVQFDDTASNSSVTVAATVSPGAFNVTNNVLNYVFSGTHAITGSAGLNKSGSATLTLADTGGDSFTGGLTVSGGALVLDNAGSSIGGHVTISGGSLQLGNNDANGNLPGAVADNGSLILNRSDNLNVANVISGSGTVSQIGTDVVTLSGINSSFSGKMIITNGVLNTTATTGLGAATALTVTNTGTFDDNGIAFNANAPTTFVVSGAGYNGAGAIINSGAQQTGAFSNITVTANVTFGGANRWDIRASSGTAASLNMSPAGSPYSITKVGLNEVSLVSVGTIDAGLGNILVQQGEFAIQLSTAQLGNPASNLVVSAGALLEMFGAATPLNKVITFNGNGTNDSFKSDTDTAGQNVVIGPVTLNGNCVFDVSSGQFATFDNVIGGTGGLTKITSGVLTLTNVNTYTGNTTINGGVLALSGSGSVASSNIVIAAGASLNAASRTNQTLTLLASQTLSGFGSVTGLVVEAGGSTIAPGSATSVGVLTFGNNVTLAGASTMKVSRVLGATNDVLNISGTLVEGGTLNVTSLGGTYVAGDTFKLFTTTGAISGSFSATNLPALGGGLGWVTTNLANGILTVVNAVNTNPTNITALVSGNMLTLSWPADHLGWRLLVQTNSLAVGLNPNTNAWVAVPGSASVNSESITLDPNQGTVFYRLVYP